MSQHQKNRQKEMASYDKKNIPKIKEKPTQNKKKQNGKLVYRREKEKGRGLFIDEKKKWKCECV